MRKIVKPTEAARKEILKVFRGLDARSRNTVFVDIWSGEVRGHAFYRSDKGEELRGQPRDCYEFHMNKPKAFATYEDVDAQIEDQYAIAEMAIEDELKFLQSEIGREMLDYESEQEFNRSQAAMIERLAEMEARQEVA